MFEEPRIDNGNWKFISYDNDRNKLLSVTENMDFNFFFQSGCLKL